jgi:hypothetical protein
MALPFFERSTNLGEFVRGLDLASYSPAIALDGLVVGVDNVRYDVYLSPRFTEVARAHVARLIAHYGNVADMVVPDAFTAAPQAWSTRPPEKAKQAAGDAAEFKRVTAELHLSALHGAKAMGTHSIDLLARLAAIKLLRIELATQFAEVLERCRAKVKSFEGPRQTNVAKAMELRERFARLQITKRDILRKVGEDLFQTLREIEKESLARMRRSLMGEDPPAYELFLNRLLFTEDGRDDQIKAEHYVMLGNFEHDPDRFQTMLEITLSFLKSVGVGTDAADIDAALDAILSAPENAQELVAGGTPDDSTAKGKGQKALLAAWVEALERAGVMEYVIAGYEAVPLLAQYPPINGQQLKNALISKSERKRVESLLHEHGRLSPDGLQHAVRKVAACRGPERAKMAGRFLSDFIRYHRDLRRLEALNAVLDSVNVLLHERMRELSAINNTLYEFLLVDEQRQGEEKIAHHVILKADIRDSTSLTRSLLERGLNPASYFSLNFYEPVNKLLPKYGAQKVFIEGDAVILALLGREGEPAATVGRACGLAKEIAEIVRAYNEKSAAAGLPSLELGIGVSFQDAPPMYLMDGNNRIMISRALNESDRLSSCSKAARRYFSGGASLFNVYVLQTIQDEDTAGDPDEFLVRYNVGGVNLSAEAFARLQQEISLKGYTLDVPTLWAGETVRLWAGLVPVASGTFHRIIVREGIVPHVDARAFSLKQWTERRYYELCTNPSVYDLLSAAFATAAPAGG